MLYHYTNSKGLLGILDREKNKIVFRFTDYRCLNDASEGHELDRIFQIVCQELYEEKVVSKEKYDLLQSIDFDDNHTFLYTSKEKETLITHGKTCEADVFLCCFCTSDDLIDMWRYYSKGDEGYSIGILRSFFENDTFIDHFCSNEAEIGCFEWLDVVYDDNEKKKRVRGEIERIILAERENGVINEENFKAVVLFGLKEYKYQFKHVCFSSEKEVRCVLKLPKGRAGLDKSKYKVKYLHQNDRVVPYVEVEFQKEALLSLTVSPLAGEGSEVIADEYIKSFIDSNQTVNVRRSQLPLRF